ncbi:hypothetical protein FAZ97_11890 [Paraburkholderia acidiphila]|uniref:Uncharacterized protein n=1 Tax=Paraburkholderia acidiphila TaxID=2571747 RepID=A0A7Z2G5E7_9BURK|nr:hypothetical protein FAZ97_11890 [Paraburkholderia acidiphila]
MVALLSGYFLGPRTGVGQPIASKKSRTSNQLTILFFLIFVLCIVVAIFLNHGIPLLQGEARFQNSALISNLAPLYGFWILTRMISDVERGRKPSFVQPAIYIVGILILGYRSPVLAFVLTYYCYQVIFRFSGTKALWISAIVGGGAGIFCCLTVAFPGVSEL